MGNSLKTSEHPVAGGQGHERARNSGSETMETVGSKTSNEGEGSAVRYGGRNWPDGGWDDSSLKSDESVNGQCVRLDRLTPSPEAREDNNLEEDDGILANFESNVSLKESRVSFLKDLKGPPVTFNLVLDCKGTKTVEEKELKVTSEILSQKVQLLKLCIENHHSIPASLQAVSFDSCTLEDQLPLSYYHLREGDYLRVVFERKGDLTEIMEVIDSMKETYIFLKSKEHEIRKGVDEDTLLQINRKVCSEEVESLPDIYFANNNKGKAEINRIFFADCGGVAMFHKLHEQLLKHSWSHMPLKLQALERALLRSFWNLTADFTVRMAVLHKSRALQNIIKSFLRIKVEKGCRVKAPVGIYESFRFDRYRWDYSAANVAFKSMGTLCNLAEIPECHLKIASNKAVLKQLIAMMSCQEFKEIAAMIAMGGLLCLSHSACTHKYLAHISIVTGVLEHCMCHLSTSGRHSKLTPYFAVILYAIILSTSPHLVSLDAKLAIADFNASFYEEADYLDIRLEEIKNGFKWSTLVPYMKLAYHAHEHPHKDLAYNETEHIDQLKRLNRFCIASGIFSMANLLQSPANRDTFLEEGLLDYLVCMPWLYPRDWPERKEAEQLVAFMGQHVHLQPPSLINLTKAKLAAMYFGLERVLSTDSVHQLLAEVYI